MRLTDSNLIKHEVLYCEIMNDLQDLKINNKDSI